VVKLKVVLADRRIISNIKTADEIEKIKESCQIVADVLRLMEKNIQAGITTKELDRIAEDFILTCGGKPACKGVDAGYGVPYEATLCVSINEEVVHGIPSDRKIENGDIVSVDVVVVKNSYYGDGARTFSVGEISDEKRLLMKVTEESLRLGIEKAIPGNRLFQISKAVQDHVESNGFSVVRDLVGHGVGRSMWEFPQIPNFVPKKFSLRDNPVLVEGLTLAIEPMVNIGSPKVKVKSDKWTVYAADMKSAAHFEHTILITKDKAEILTI
jgi:methionyl aminopeptidase